MIDPSSFESRRFRTAADHYLAGRPLIEKRGEKYAVVSLDGKTTYIEAPTWDAARDARDAGEQWWEAVQELDARGQFFASVNNVICVATVR